MSETARPPSPENTAAFVFTGFDSPNTTQVPDAFFDVVAPQLTEAELRVSLYIIRRTFGFKKDSDTISLRQMVDGITTKDGRVLDRGTGLKKSAVANALNGLERKGVILSRRNQSRERGHEPTTYALHIKHHPLSVPVDKGMSIHTDKPLSVPVDTQYTVVQQTEKQQTDRNSNHFDDIAMMQQNQTRSVFSKGVRSFATSQEHEFSTGRVSTHAATASLNEQGAVERSSSQIARKDVVHVGEILGRRQGKRSAERRVVEQPVANVADASQAPEIAPETGVPPASRPKRRPATSRGMQRPKRGADGRQEPAMETSAAAGAPPRGRPPKLSPYLEDLVDRFSEELHDEEHQPQNRGQAARLWKASGRSEAAFGQALIEARAITLGREIKKRAKVGGEFGLRNKAPYFFTVLRDVLGLKEEHQVYADT